ncbi:RNA interference pathway ago1 [Hyphodiscus hymeniophilus]|uniref:RNA interference pathway ago1 n=1 Tax=Hyphodiscus hymeniophilus TaxID=353542 RepID=A0A9P7AVE2_9HELO|nr:RNA interference pathway ago1 [Hyphodiscus hymeniophilus]
MEPHARQDFRSQANEGNFKHPATALPARPALNSAGKQITIRVNQFKITQIPNKDIYQYDILIGSGAEKRGLVKAVWECQSVRNKLKTAIRGPWLWNGDKIAWCSFNVPEIRMNIDMDKERGRPPPQAGQPPRPVNHVMFVLKPAKVIRLAVLNAFLSRQTPFDNSCLEGISKCSPISLAIPQICVVQLVDRYSDFLDHLIRQGPSEKYTTIKRSFYAPGGQRHPLDNVVEAMRGVYSSVRLCELNPSVGGPGTGLALNVDAANGTFWTSQSVHQAARNLCKNRNRNLSFEVFRDQLLPTKSREPGVWTFSPEFKELRKMHKLKFKVKHRGKQDDNKIYTIKKFTWIKNERDANLARVGQHAKNTTFPLKNRANPTAAPVETSIYDYFVQRYNIRLEYWQLPLIETTRDGLFPMELCILVANQRYQYKLTPDQTASMIKFAVTRPKERLQAINHGVEMLKWQSDRYLDFFDLKVDPNLTLTQARLLAPPEVQYAGSKANPGLTGRWDLRGKKLLLSNPDALKSWSLCIVQEACPETVARNFLNVFIQTYIGHGGKVMASVPLRSQFGSANNKNPPIHVMQRQDTDLAKAVQESRQKAGNEARSAPQIVLFVLPGRDSAMYDRLKKNMECRFGMVSQMLNVAHVTKAQPQYCSNVCMKLNAKLGGTTCKVADKPGAKPFFPVKTMIIGADVSHPAPGSPQPSMAALTMSMDANACRYAAGVQTNGIRVEMLTEANILTLFVEMFGKWINKVGGGSGPQHIYYFRDGVSEGQFQQVLDQEVAVMKRLLINRYGEGAARMKWTVVVCTKRHHIRLFPKEGDAAAGDRNNNALPGTLVERDVTHPFEYDFYLNSHSAIQGTARPVHYQVIMDEAQCAVNEFQRLIYHHCYQYARSTTTVSLFPAVYYAHLASNRARAHESKAASDGPRGGQKFEEAEYNAANLRRQGIDVGSSQTGSSIPEEVTTLLPLGNSTTNTPAELDHIRLGMWYI